jgi:hypothetical protein
MSKIEKKSTTPLVLKLKNDKFLAAAGDAKAVKRRRI